MFGGTGDHAFLGATSERSVERDADGEEARVHIPALYAGSHAEEQDALRLGRLTEWRDRGGLYRGAGQRVLLAAAGGETSEHSLLSVRSLQVDKVQ